MANRIKNVSPNIIPWGSEGSTYDPIRYIRRDNSTPYSRVTNKFRSNLARYQSTSPVQRVVNKGYKDYVNVSKSLNREEAETKEASKYYDRLKKAEKYLDNKRGFNANDPSWDLPGIGFTDFFNKEMIGDIFKSTDQVRASNASGKVMLNKETSATVDLAKKNKELKLLRLQLLQQLQDYSNNRSNLSNRDKLNIIRINSQIKLLDKLINNGEVYEQRAELLRAQHDVDNVWDSVREGLAGAAGFLFDTFSKMGASLSASSAFGVHNTVSDVTKETNSKEKFALAAHLYIYNKNIDNNKRKYKGLSLKDSLVAQIDDYTDFLNLLNAEIKGAQDDYEKHVRYRLADEKWFPLSDDYNKKKLRYANASVFSPEYWQYEMPSQIAASNASTAGRIAAAINTTAAIGGAFLGPKGQAILNVGSQVATTATGLDIENMKFENRGEVSDANVDKLKSNLMAGGKGQYLNIIKDLREKAKQVYPRLNMNPDTESDDEILRSALAGIITSNHPEYRKAELRALAGSNALFQKDNITTGSNLMVQKGLQVGIFGRELYKAGKGTINWIANKTIKRAANSATGRIEHTVEGAATNAAAEAAKDAVNGSRYATLRKEFNDSFRSGFGLGLETATVLGHGMTGQYVYGTMTGFGKAVLDQAKKALPTRGQAFIRLATHRAGLYYQDILDKIPLTARRLSAYGLKMGKVWAVSSASEAAEEARQYVNAELAKRQQMGLGELPSLGSLFANEYSAGSRTQAAILAELGIGDSDLLDNEEFWLNYKGGFALGGGHTVAMRAVSEIPGLVRQISADLAILNAGITNRVMMQNERAQGLLFAKEAMKGRSNMELILNTMQELKLEDARRKEHTYSSDEWDASIKAALDIMRMTLSPTTKAIMEKHGIQYGTDKYAAAVASVYLTGLNSDENRDLRQKAIDEYNLIIHSVLFNLAIDEELRRRQSGSSIESLALQRADKARQEAEQNALSLEELGLEIDLISAQSELDKLNRMTGPTGISNVEDLRQRTILVGLLRGLLKLRADCKTSDGFFNMLRDKFGLHTIREDAAKIHKSIDSDIKIISLRLSELSGINLDGLNDAQVMDKLDAMGAIELFSDDIEENTRVRALLNADAKLISDRLKMFSDGLKAEGNGNTKFSKFIDDVMATTERNKAIDWALADAINDPYGQKWNQDNTSTGEINTDHKDTLSHVESLTKLENKVYYPENNYSVENNTFLNTDRPYVHDDLELKIKEDKLGSVGKLKGKIDDMILRGKSYDKINRWLQSSKRYKNIITRNEDNARIIEDYINDLLLNAGLEPNRAIVEQSKPEDELTDAFERLNNLSEQRQERNERRAKIEAKKRLLKSKMKAAIKEWARSGEIYSGVNPKILTTFAKLVAYGTQLGYYSFKAFLDDVKTLSIDDSVLQILSDKLPMAYTDSPKRANVITENLDSAEAILEFGSVLDYLKNDKPDKAELLKQNVDKLVQLVKQNLSNILNIESAIQKISDLSLTPFDKTNISLYILDVDKFTTEELLRDAIKLLGNIIQNTNLVYNDLTDLLNNINNLKEIPQDPLVTDYNDLPKTIALLVLELEDACNTLDAIASTIADVKPTTQPERDAINDLSILLMRAEIALDNLLLDNEALAVNVSLERDLIDNVIMKFNNNKSIWGDASEEILDWWFTKYAKDNVILPRDSRNTITNGSDNLTLDYNKKITDYIRLYGNRFKQNLSEIESDWYWRLLKNYFGTLLNNAQDYIEQNPDNPMNSVILDNINRGRLLISGFANKYGKQLDDSYMDTDASIIREAEELNKQEFMWYESGGNNYISGQGVGTTLHRPGVKAMQENKTYVEWSNQPDFITNGKFEIIFKNATEYSNRPYLRITYKGQSIELHIYEGGDESRMSYQQHLVDLWKFCLKHKNYSLRVIPTRTNGSLIYDPAFVGYNENSPTVDGLHSVVGNIMSLDDTYSIDLKSKLIGIVKLDKKGNMNVMSLDGLNSPIHTLNSARVGTLNTSVGSTVYLWHTNFDEKKGNLTTIPVILYQSKLSLNQADSLVDLLRAYALGLVNYNGYNTYDLIKMLVHVNENNLPNYRTNQTRTITFSSNKLIIIGLPQYDDNNKHVDGTGESYDLTSEHDLERLRTDLRSVGVAFEKTMLSQLLNFTNNSVINNVKHYFEDNPSANTFVAPNGLEFSRDDFFDQDGNERRKSTYAGYLMRHQYTLTSVIGLNYTATYFRGPYLVPNTKQDDRIDDILTKQQKEDSISMPRLNSLKDLLKRSRGLKLEVQPNKLRDITDGDRERMDAYLKRVIGEGNYDIGKLLNDDIPADMAVAGKCMSDMVYIGNRVVNGVLYHEAFHRVLELLLRPSERQKIYDWYKNREGDDKMSDTDVAEGLANLYMDAQNNYDDNEFSNNKVVALFLKIKAGVLFARDLGSIRLTLLSAVMATGWYKTKAGSKIRKENLERFKAKFGDSLHYDVYNQKTGMKHSFENILNNEQLNDCVETIAFYIVEKALEEGRVNAVGDNIDQLTITGTNIKKLIGVDMMKLLMGEDPEVPVPEALAKAFLEIFKQGKERYITNKDGVAIGKELYYPNFAVIADRVYAKIANISKEGVVRNTNDEDMQELLEAGSAGAYMDYVGKESYEMSKLQSVSQKAKFFFGTVPYVKWANANNHKEGIELDTSHSLFGDPRFMPQTEVFSKMFELLHNVKTVQELHDELARLASQDPMFFYVYSTFNEYFLAQYIDYDKTTGEGINYNAEAVVTLVFQALVGQKYNFMMTRSSTDKDGRVSVRMSNLSVDRDTLKFSQDWSKRLANGVTGVVSTVRDQSGRILFNRDRRGVVYNAPGNDIFKRTSNWIKDIWTQANAGNEIKIGNNTYDITSPVLLSEVIDKITITLNKIGIQIDSDTINYMLINKYGEFSADSFRLMLNETTLVSLSKFLNLLDSVIGNAGLINVDLDTLYNKDSFVNELAKYLSMNNKVKNEMMNLLTNNNKAYTLGENNTVSDILADILDESPNNQAKLRILNFCYNKHSIVLRRIAQNEGNKIAKILMNNYAGFKTDQNDDYGSDYNLVSEVEDYMSKVTMLISGGLIYPTMSDKKTYMYLQASDQAINGFLIPGVDYRLVNKLMSSSDNELKAAIRGELLGALPRIVTDTTGKTIVRPSDLVLDIFIDYAKDEKAAILECMHQLGYFEGDTAIDDTVKIKNYHTPNKYKNSKGETVSVEPNGTRFSSLTSILDDNGKRIKFNDPKKSSIDCLKLADELFFNKSREQLRNIMARVLDIQFKEEVKKAIKLGLIKGDIDNYYSLENVGLSWNEFNSIRQSFAGTEGITTLELMNAAAVVAMMSDISTRSIISVQEVERLFGGHPAFYKWKYSENELEDRQTDLLKRLGGLISTGANPRTDFQDDSESQYTCAQVDDFMVSSEADKMHDGNIDDAYQNSVEKMFVLANTKEAVYNKLVRSGKSKKEAAEIAYAEHKTQKDFEEFRDKYLDENDKVRVTKKYQAEYKAYAGKIYDPKAKNPINVADGSAFITDRMCEKLLRSLGLYNNKAKLLFAMLRDPDKLYTFRQKADAFAELLEFIVGAQKYSAFGHRNDDHLGSLLIPYYNKMALFPIFPSIAMGDMGKVYNKMINEGVDMLLFDSAVKIGNKHNSEFKLGKGIEEPFVTFKQDLRYLRKQLNTDPNGKTEMNLGTQTAKVALASLILDRTNYTDSLTGETISGSLILDNIMDSIKLLSDIGVKEVDDLFFTNDEFDIQKFAKFLNDELTSRNANKNTIDAITIKVDDADGSKHLNVPLAAQSDPHWIESILTSALNKRIIDVKTPGNAFYQRSVFAMEGNVISDDEYDKLPAAAKKLINWQTLNEGKLLLFVNNDGSMDAVISIDYFEHIIPEGMSFDLARKWLFDNKIIGNRSDVKANTIGYRIPTQAQSSIHALRFVDVLPVVKDTIILPREFTKVTGSDFDIDKLYLASLAYNVKDNKASIEFDKDTKQYHLNKLLENYMTLLKDNENSILIAMRSIDNDTELVESIANQFESAGSTKTLPYNFYTLHELTDRRRDYITGKLGIAPFALNVTNLALTMAYGVKLKESEFTKQTPFKRIDLRDDKNGNAVMSWLSAFINAHCDIVKDPYVSKINVNSFTYNMLNFLVRTGLADNSVWFITQPIIKDMAFAAEAASGHYGRDLTKSKYRALKDATEKALRQYIAGYLGITINNDSELYNNSDIRREINYINSDINSANTDAVDHDLIRIDIINSMFKSDKYLKNYALKYTSKEDMLKDPDFCKALILVYKAWNILQPFVSDISKLVLLTKIDTKKQGNTLAKLLLYKDKYDLFLKDIQNGNTSFEPYGVMRMMTHSWIDKKTNSFMKAMKSILAGQVFEATTSYTSLVGLLGQFMNNYSQTEDIANKLDRNVSQCIKSLFIRSYAEINNIDVNRLFFGNNTIADRLANIKRRINNPDDKLFYLRNNKLLTSLVESDQVKDETTIGNNGQIYPAPKFVSTFHSISESSFNQDDLTDAWEELLDYPDDLELKDFARDLVVYAWLTSGEKSGFNRFFKYVPNSWKIKSGFVGHVEFWLNKFNTNLESDVRNAIIDDILRNNWNDTDFVPLYDYIRKNQRNFTDSGIYDPLLMKPLSLCGYTLNGKGEWVTTINRLDNGQYPRYITVKDEIATKGNNNSNRALYRLIGVSKFDGIKDKDTGNTSLTEVPIYALCKKRGLHFKGNDIFEFGNSDFGFAMNYIGYQENDSQYAKLIELIKLKLYIDTKKLEPEETKTESPVKNTDVTTVRSTGKSGGITYNKELQSAIINAVSFLKTNTDPTLYYVIEGKAGTGKTTIAKEILKEFEDESIYVAAVSHKAKGVIKNSFGEDTRGKKFFSIASLLGLKGINDNDTLTIKFQTGTKVPLLDNPPALLVIDEASMITEDVLKKIIDINSSLSRPFLMLFLGDIGQILPIRDDLSEFYRTHKDLLNKKSDIFNSKHKSKLVTRVRLGEANPILPYADYFWENSLKENPELNPTLHIVRNNLITDKGSLLFSNSEGEVLNSVIKAVKNAVEKGLTNHIKIVTYHVNEKTELNQKIHEALFGKDSDYSKGDMLILNSPYDLPDTKGVIENSAEIQIRDIDDTDVDEYGIHTLYLETTGTAYSVTGQEIKDCTIQVVSRQDIGKYNQKLAELASVAKRLTNRILKKLAWKEFWEYKGRYADVDFGYAITAHKSLGSTYDIVVVDEKDIMGTSATSNQEKSELIYTALTRPRKTAIVISSVPVSNPYTGDIENPSLPKLADRKIEYHPGNWTRLEVNDNPDVLYIFGDNTNRTSGSNLISNDSKYARTYGLGKMFPNTTAAVIRGMDNAMPVSTQHWYDPTTGRTRDAGRWNDSDIDDFKKVIDAEFLAIKDEWDTGKYRKIYLPSTGLSNGKISQITEARTPVLFKYLYDKTADLAKYVSTEHKDTHNVSYELALKTISSPNTILTNEEILALHPFTGSDTHPRIAVASEKTDPAFFAKLLEDFFSGKTTVQDYRGNILTANDMDALYIITKHDGLPMRRILSIQKPKIIHFSITTLGGTKWEPGVMKWQDMIERVGKFIKQGLDPKMVTLRIDPIVPGVTLIPDVELLIKRASELGIKNVKFSVMDYYRTTSIFMKNLGYDYEKNGYEKLANGEFKPNASPEKVKRISEEMLKIANKYGVKLSTCAEPGVIPGISKQGCLSVQLINNILGTHIEDKAEANNRQRLLCTCYGGKVDVLRYNSNCASSCMYCYAHHNSDKMLNYYNEDGTLKDNAFTRTDQNTNEFYSEDGKTPLTIYRGYALTEDREAKTLNETVGKTAVDYDETLKGALYFTSSEEEATDYAKSRTDKSPEPPTVEHPEGNRINRHYTGDYAKVSKFHILSTAKVEHYKDIRDYAKNGRNSTADVIVLDKGTMWSDNTEYVVKNPNVIVFAKEKGLSALLQNQNNNPQDYTMNSGGAYGGDTYWDVIGRSFGITNINHFRPIDNLNMSKTLRDRNVKPFSITHEQSNYARELIKQLTGREIHLDLAGELLARDFYQVDKSDGVFAIANITSSLKSVEGGTNMAVLIGIKLSKPVHVYDLNTESWYLYNQSTGKFEVEDTPVLTKSFAGVGTRNILNYKVNKNGLWVDREGYVGYDKALKAANAIKAVYLKTFSKNDYKVKNEQEIKDDLKELGKRRLDDCNK